jgi:energy-converting hydrogenase B subunit D
MIGLISLILMIIMIISAIMVIFQKDLINAIVALSLVSLIAVIFFFIMKAPDVALTEASIGAGLTIIIFIVAIKKTRRFEENDE